MEVIIHRDAPAVAAAAARILADYVSRGATLGLATGSTPLATYRELIRMHREEGLDFSATRAFLLDEYLGLPPEDPRSYFHTIRHEFTHHINISDANVHSPDGMNPDSAAAGAAYEAAITAAGGIDIQLLGIGTNGHVGFNEPGSSLNSLTRRTTLHPQTISDNARFFDSAADVPVHVITQGLGTIQRAGHALLIATGEGKAAAVARMIEGPVSALMPASVLQLHPQATVIIDEAAARDLELADYFRFVQEQNS